MKKNLLEHLVERELSRTLICSSEFDLTKDFSHFDLLNKNKIIDVCFRIGSTRLSLVR